MTPPDADVQDSSNWPSRVKNLGYHSVATILESQALSAAILRKAPLSPRTGISKLGGLPDLPDYSLWPKHKGKSLSFIAQINLSDLPQDLRAELPSTGMLFFFYDAEGTPWGFDPSDKGSWSVLYVSSPPDAVEVKQYPPDLPEHARFREVPVALRPAKSFPDPSKVVYASNLDAQQQDAVLDEYQRFVDAASPLHQLLGHPAPIQGDMELECQLTSNGLYTGNESGYNDPRAAALAPGAKDWRLLLQVDTDDDSEMIWGDGGRLYFWIRRQDLSNKRFEHVWMILQCY